MDLKAQKEFAEKVRAVANDKVAVTKLADDAEADNPDCEECAALCERFRNAADGAAVTAVCDEVAAKKDVSPAAPKT